MDANQAEIVRALRAIGASVAITSALGDGFPDLVVGFRGKNFLVELKDGRKPPSARKLTEAEECFSERWRGQIAIINNIEEAIKLLNKV